MSGRLPVTGTLPIPHNPVGAWPILGILNASSFWFAHVRVMVRAPDKSATCSAQPDLPAAFVLPVVQSEWFLHGNPAPFKECFLLFAYSLRVVAPFQDLQDIFYVYFQRFLPIVRMAN